MIKPSLFEVCMERHVSFQSSECEQGSVFFALPGAKVDGHQYLMDAQEHGATHAVVDERYKGNTYDLHCVRVANTMETLHAVAAQAVKRYRMRVIAITGSCGKTTTKEYTAAMLSTKYDVEKSPGTRNSQIGLPTAIINMRKDAELYVFEMGMSESGEIAKLVSIAPPEVAAITMIGRAHLAFFDSIESIARAKNEIFSVPTTTKKFIGESVTRFPILTEGSEVVLFRRFDELDTLPGHFHDNASIALAIAELYGVDKAHALASLNEVQDVRRFCLQEHEGIYWLSDSYNSIPEALLAALQNLPQKGIRKGALLSHMAELGETSKKIHEEIGEKAAFYLDYVVCYGEDMKAFQNAFELSGKKAYWYSSREKAAEGMQTIMQKGDLVLVKGANSQKLWELIPCYS